MKRIDELRSMVAGTTRRLYADDVEFRAEADEESGAWTVRGHAAVFDRMSEDLGGFRERVKRGAFRKALDQDQDVRLLFNHDPDHVLARTKSKTLELREDPKGLHVFADAARTGIASDLRELMARGDVDQMSFGFTVAEDEWTERDGEITRTILEIDRLFDVSVVTFPAYTQTDASMRDLGRRIAEEAFQRALSKNGDGHVTTTPSNDGEPPEVGAAPDAGSDQPAVDQQEPVARTLSVARARRRLHLITTGGDVPTRRTAIEPMEEQS